MRVLIVSNLDSARPYGQFTRPYFLGRGMAEQGIAVANVGIDCSKVDFGPSWSTGRQSLARLARAVAFARHRFEPDVVYAHQNLPGTAALLVAAGVPVVADFHSLPSVEWSAHAAAEHGTARAKARAQAAKALLAERLLARRANRVIAAGEVLGLAIARRCRPPAPPLVVVNGVDPRLLEAPASATPYRGDRGARHALAILPASASPANRRALEFLRDVARELRGSPSGFTVHVLGTEAGPADPLLEYHGVQPDLLPWIDHADVCLLPYPGEAKLYGGAKNKLLEYLARGQAIVTTPEGLRGLEHVEHWRGVQTVPDDVKTFAAAIESGLASDAARLDDARTAVRERLRWDVLAIDVADALRQVARPS